MKKVFFVLSVSLFILSVANFIFADTVYLKSGAIAKGNIAEQSDGYVKVDIDGVTVTYFSDEIDRLEKENNGADPGKMAPEGQLYDFNLGVHRIGEKKNVIEFKLPGGDGDLYLFNISPWEGLTGDKTQMSVSLYNADKKLIESKKSACVSGASSAFGSIAFKVSKYDVENVKYFSLAIKDCAKKPASMSGESNASVKGQLGEAYSNYAKAIYEKNLEDVKKYMTRRSIEQTEKMTKDPQGLEMFFSLVSSMTPRELSNVQEDVKQDEAVLSADNVKVSFKKENGAWKVDKVDVAIASEGGGKI